MISWCNRRADSSFVYVFIVDFSVSKVRPALSDAFFLDDRNLWGVSTTWLVVWGCNRDERCLFYGGIFASNFKFYTILSTNTFFKRNGVNRTHIKIFKYIFLTLCSHWCHWIQIRLKRRARFISIYILLSSSYPILPARKIHFLS